MSKRKQYIIDKKFQVKTTFSIIAVVSIITAVIVAAIAVNIVGNNTKIDNIHNIEDNIVQFLYTSSLSKNLENDKNYQIASRKVFLNHVNNLKTLKSIIKYNQILLVILVISIIIQGILLYIMLIRKTHRISGPIYVMSMYMKQILDGQKPIFRKLREKDELKDFYDLFQETVNKLQLVPEKKQVAHISLLTFSKNTPYLPDADAVLYPDVPRYKEAGETTGSSSFLSLHRHDVMPSAKLQQVF